MHLIPTAVGVLALGAITTAVLWAVRVPDRWAPLLAILRGTLQLAAISVILTGVIGDARWIACALLVMFTVASTVSARRIGWSWRRIAMTSTAIGGGVLVAATVVFASGMLALSSRYALAVGAILVGNAMSVATLTGRMLVQRVDEHWDEVEGWLALGATPRQSTIAFARQAVRDALIPSVDQTKTTGLVVLPGAFIGAIFGGVSPLEAGRFQIVVLAAIMAAGAVTAVTVAHWMGPMRTRPIVR